MILLFSLAGCNREQAVLAGGKSVEYWIGQCHDADPAVRREAVARLGNVGGADPAAPTALIAALKDSSAAVRREAIVGILKARPALSEVRKPLAALQANDRDLAVRRYAAVALQRLGQESER
jgi:HEAT repeat protein